MAHSNDFHIKDLKAIKSFIKHFRNDLKGERLLDLCGGMGKIGSALQNRYDYIDVFDISPSFGDIEAEKRGKLIRFNLKDIGDLQIYEEYDLVFGNWALCYVGFEQLSKVLSAL